MVSKGDRMVITLPRNSYTMTDVAISHIHYRHSKPLYYLLALIVIWLLFTPHFESFLCVTRIAAITIAIASGVILADLEDELIGRVIQFVLSFIKQR